MKTFNQLNEFEKIGVMHMFKSIGFENTVYYPENEKGFSKGKVGFMLKDLIIDE